MQDTNGYTDAAPDDRRGTNNMKKLINDIVAEKVVQEHPMERRATPMGMTQEDSREINEILEASPPMTPTDRDKVGGCCGCGHISAPTILWYVGACILFIVGFVALVLSVLFFINDSQTDRALKLFGIVGASVLILITFIIVFMDCWIDGTRLYLEEAVVYRVFQVKEADAEAMALDGNRRKEDEGEKEKPPALMLQQKEKTPAHVHRHRHNHPMPYMIPAYVYYPAMVPANSHLFHGHGHGHNHGHIHGHGHGIHGHGHGTHGHGHGHGTHGHGHGHNDNHGSQSVRYRHYPEANRSLSHLSVRPRRVHTISPSSSQIPIVLNESHTSNPGRLSLMNTSIPTSDKSVPVIRSRKIIQKHPKRISHAKVKIGDAITGTHIDQMRTLPTTAITYDNIPPNVTEVIRETTVVKAPRSLIPTLRKTLAKPNNGIPAVPE